MGDDDRKYIVTMLGTVLVTYVQRASRKDCLTVAESLVRKFPFLKDPVSDSYPIYIYSTDYFLTFSIHGRISSTQNVKT